MQDYSTYIQICEELACRAASKGNSAVRSLIILSNEIVAKAEEAASTKQDVSCHAEMEVIRKARKVIGSDMSKANLVTNKEPCIMCSYAIRYHKIAKVVYKERTIPLGGFYGHFTLLTTNEVPAKWGPAVTYLEVKT